MIKINRKTIRKDADEMERILFRKEKIKNITIIIFGVIFIAAIAFTLYFFLSWRIAEQKVAALSTPEGQQKLIQQEVNDLVSKISKHVVLPTGEVPTMATITDIDTLKKEQPFYNDAHNGDKILIYKNAQKGFIYDPSRDLVVNEGPVYFQADNTATTNTPANTSTK